MIYFDNAATSWPKPPEVATAMMRFLETVGANPGRSGHRLSVEAGRIVYGAREAVCQFFPAPDPLRLVWCKNVTEALNLALRGLLRPGDHVITSSMEHNSLMRSRLQSVTPCVYHAYLIRCGLKFTAPLLSLDRDLLRVAEQAGV